MTSKQKEKKKGISPLLLFSLFSLFQFTSEPDEGRDRRRASLK